MFESIKQALAQMESLVRDLDPQHLAKREALEALECFAKIEKLGAAGKALCAKQVANTDVWWEVDGRSPAHCVATLSGTTIGRAFNIVHTAELLENLPATEAAYRAGKLSQLQVEEIVTAAAMDHAAEWGLLTASEIADLEDLRRQCARVRAAARSEKDKSEFLHRRRELKHWIDWEGAFRLSGRLTPEAGAVVMASLEPFRQKETIRGKNKDKPAAYLADALVAMAEHSRKVPQDALRPGPGAVVHVRVDYEALKRGHLERGEVCEVPGVGPIPVAAAKEFLGDAFLKAVVTKGKDVTAVANLGRYIPDQLKTAVVERDQMCVVPGCGNQRDMEVDHVVPRHRHGPTKLRNLALLCRWHHYLKTHHGYRLRKMGGGWLWEPPNGPPRDDEGKLQPELTEAS